MISDNPCYSCAEKEDEITQLEKDLQELQDRLYEFADLTKEYDDSRDPLILVALVKLARKML